MGKCYYELRKKPANGNGLSTDIMRHLNTRQHLGKAVVICDDPRGVLSAARKQWLRLTRHVQKQRAATLDADKILKYTHTVTHMQRMRFTAKTPLEESEADVFFLTPQMIADIPAQCLSAYLTTPLTMEQMHGLSDQLSPSALAVDYAHNRWHKSGFLPKIELESQLSDQWGEIKHFLSTYHIEPVKLFNGQMHNVDAIDEALDILLGASQKFLGMARDFNHALELARPVKLTKNTRQQYDAVTLLAHRVQALTPGAFTQQFLETYSEDDTFFLHDAARGSVVSESLSQTISRHLKAGRVRLAAAIQQTAQRSTLQY